MAANLDNSDKGISKDKPINTAVLAVKCNVTLFHLAFFYLSNQ